MICSNMYIILIEQKKATCNQTDGFQYSHYKAYPFKASAPPTISKISLVMAALRALL